MKSLLLKCTATLFILGLIFSACKKNGQSFESKGVINLDVLLTCNGCPGSRYDIKFANDTNVYYVGNDLTPFGITTNTKLPVNVSVNWKPDDAAARNFVIITALKVNN